MIQIFYKVYFFDDIDEVKLLVFFLIGLVYGYLGMVWVFFI